MPAFRSFLLLALTTSCFAQTAHNIAQKSFKSVVLLTMSDANGQPIALGSGFFAAHNVIATNAHVIDGASGGTAKLIGSNERIPILGVLAIDRQADLALLSVESQAPHLFLGNDIGGYTHPSVGDPVFVAGNPLGLEGTLSDGIVSGIRAIGSDTLIQMTAPISPGSSGGPVMDASGAVIGIAVATYKDGQNLNFAVPVTYLNKLLNSPTHLANLGAISASSQGQHSIVDSLGSRPEDGVVASDFRWESMSSCYNFRLTNKTPNTVSRVRLYVVFYDSSGAVVDYEKPEISATIPSGLAKTVQTCPDQGDNALTSVRYDHEVAQDNGQVVSTLKIQLRVLGYLTVNP